MSISSYAPDPTSGIPRGPCLPCFLFVLSFLAYEINFDFSYNNVQKFKIIPAKEEIILLPPK